MLIALGLMYSSINSQLYFTNQYSLEINFKGAHCLRGIFCHIHWGLNWRSLRLLSRPCSDQQSSPHVGIHIFSMACIMSFLLLLQCLTRFLYYSKETTVWRRQTSYKLFFFALDYFFTVEESLLVICCACHLVLQIV